MGQIVTKEMFKNAIRPELKKENKTIALCHGVFDLIHPGHIIHFEQAHQMADVLVVSITSAEFVRKGPGRPYFDNEMRMKFLSEIACIDYVMLSECYTVDDIVESVEPDYYVKGEEYAKESEDITGKIREERELVEKYGGTIRYTSGAVFSSTKLINTVLSGLPEDVKAYMENMKNRFSMKDVKRYAEESKKLKILVVGDTIIDRYCYCNVQGLMSKDPAYSARLKSTEDYLGGALAIARHLASFSKNVTMMSIVGNEINLMEKIENDLAKSMELDLLHSERIPTIVKQRYLTKNDKRDEYQKIFVVNNIQAEKDYESEIKSEFIDKLSKKIEEYDVVFLCDFGHGLIDPKAQKVIEEKAKYLVLNCQTNSTNYGMNIITKYHHADAFTLDQKELKLAFPMYALNEKLALQSLSKHLNGNGWLTRGSMGAWGIKNEEIYECPALTLQIKDTIGAGDSFFAVAGLYAATGADVELCTLMGNIGGALGANIIGNKSSVDSVDVLKFASTLMNV